MPAGSDAAPARRAGRVLTAPSGPPAPRTGTALFAGVEPLEVFVDVLSDLESGTPPSGFYDRLCEAICRLTTMRRAAIFLYDSGRQRVRAVGAHGTSFVQLAALRPTLADTPIAQRALAENRVVVVSDRIEDAVPPAYARILGITTLVCTPLSAADRPYGVICADRGGGRFELTDGERHLMWTLGKTAALAATARHGTRQQERARRLSERLDLAREIHERVIQRLFGVSLVLGAEQPLPAAQRARCRQEMSEALADLRTALERPLAHAPSPTATTLREELARLPVELSWPEGVEVPSELEALAQAVLAEAVRNARKHADPSRIEVALARADRTLTLEVRNDGVRAARRGSGLGLRLATFDALAHGGFVEYGAAGEQGWRVRLVVPVPEPG